MEMSYERQSSAHHRQPCRGAVPCPEGWRLAGTGELLVSVLGLSDAKPYAQYSREELAAAVNTNGKPATGTRGQETVDNSAQRNDRDEPTGDETDVQPVESNDVVKDEEPVVQPTDSENKEGPVQEGTDVGSGGVGVDPTVFAVGKSGEDITLTLVAPHTHASTRWTINGVAQDSKGNTCVVKAGDVVVAKSAKGEFTATV